MEIKTELTCKGTRILFGEKAHEKAKIIEFCEANAKHYGFQRMYLPVLQFQETFKGKVGEENKHMMYNFKDAGDRDLCLAPEYTAVIQHLATTQFKYQKDVKLFYTQECFRGEKPQAGRYRQFTQFGVEVINPTVDYLEEGNDVVGDLVELAEYLVQRVTGFSDSDIIVNRDATRGLDYYTPGKGFEISLPTLGAQKQVVGGGAYPGGVGFAIGIDRLLLTK